MILWALLAFGALIGAAGSRRARLAAISFVAIALVAQPIVTEFALAKLQDRPAPAEPRWGPRNVIVVLGAGTVVDALDRSPTTHVFGRSRVLEAARLYFDCRKHAVACRVLASGGDVNHSGRSEADLLGDACAALGIPAADLEAERESLNTFENARNVSGRLVEGEKVWLVTSGFHMKRAKLYFSHFGIVAEPAPSDRIKIHPGLLASDESVCHADLALHEFLGILRYHVYEYLGRNAPAPGRRR